MLIAPRGIGVRSVGGEERVEVRFRVRIENRSETPLTLVPAELELMDANLEPFGPADVVADGSRGQDGEQVSLVYFPFPEGRRPSNMDLRSLRLRLGLLHGNELLAPTATFDRIHRYSDPYYYGYPDFRWSIGFGYGVCY